MELEINSKDWIEVFTLLNKLTISNIENPSLSGVLLEINDSILTFTASNLQLAYQVTLLDTNLEGEFKALIPGKLFLQILKSLSQTVKLKLSSDIIELVDGDNNYEFNALSYQNFPVIDFSSDSQNSLSTNDFIETAEKVIKAASKDMARPLLQGIYVDKQTDSLTMVATDSYRMAINKKLFVDSDDSVWQALIHFKNLHEILNVLKTYPKDEFKLSLEQNQIIFDLANVKVWSRLLSGNYPNYQSLIPKEFQFKTEVDTKQLLESSNRLSNFLDPADPIILDFNNKKLQLTASSSSLGTAEENLESNWDNSELKIGFNYIYLIEGLANVDSDLIEFNLNDPNKPVVLTEPDNPNFIYLLMPIRLDD